MSNRQKAVNVMLGTHLGDALGVPFELMTRQEIVNATCGDGVTRPRFDFDPTKRKISDTRGLAPGSTSDDSQLANATAKGLIMAGEYIHELQVLLHLEALWHDVAGWGGTTKRSLYEIDKWYREQRRGGSVSLPGFFKKDGDRQMWEAARPRNPRHPARPYPNSRGNGPSMQIAPLGLHYALTASGAFESGEALDSIFEFSRMTHEDPICAVAAYAVASVVYFSFIGGPAAAKAQLVDQVKIAESRHRYIHHPGGERFLNALSVALILVDKPEDLWVLGSAGRSDSMTSVPMALAIWWRHAFDDEPTAAVLEAINAGGDTDTVGAMVGAMMGAGSDREDWWPDEWVHSLLDRGAGAQSLGKRLYETSDLRNPPEGYDIEELKRSLGY